MGKAASVKTALYTQRSTKRQLHQRQSTDLRRDKMTSNEFLPQQPWSIVAGLHDRGRVPANSAIYGNTFGRYFEEEMASVQSRTSDTPQPSFQKSWSDMSLHRCWNKPCFRASSQSGCHQYPSFSCSAAHIHKTLAE